MEYDLKWLQNNPKNILFECISGSHAYGTATKTSDKDIRGVFILPERGLYGFSKVEEVCDEKQDVVYWELEKFIKMLSTSKSSALELLNMPEDCVNIVHPLFKKLFIDNRIDFLSQKCYYTFVEYAEGQIHKAKGTDKKMNWDKDRVTRKTPLDFCYVPLFGGSKPLSAYLEEKNLRQENCGLTKIPNMRDTYCLYHSLEHNYKGIIQKEFSNEVSLSSIPKGEEPVIVMQFNKDGYTVHCKDYKEYEEYLEKRNTARYVDVQGHNQQIDGKNMLHTIRLLQTAEDIAVKKDIIVRRENREELLDIRKGKVQLEELIASVASRKEHFKELFDNSGLPKDLSNINFEQILIDARNHLYSL